MKQANKQTIVQRARLSDIEGFERILEMCKRIHVRLAIVIFFLDGISENKKTTQVKDQRHVVY